MPETPSSKTGTVIFENFNPDDEDFECYQDRFEQFLLVSGVTEEKDMVASLIASIGGKCYRQLRDIVTPTKPKELKFSEICEKLNNHYNPRKTTLATRYNFYRRKQHDGESIAMYLANLKKLAQDCNFGTFRDTAIRDIFVCGLRNAAVQRRLFAKEEDQITLNRAEKIAVSMETAYCETEELHDEDRVKTYVKHFGLACYCCGRTNHIKKDCKYKGYTCDSYGEKGHLKQMCQRSKGGGKSTDSCEAKSTKHRLRKKGTRGDGYFSSTPACSGRCSHGGAYRICTNTNVMVDA